MSQVESKKIEAEYFPGQGKYIDAAALDRQELIRRRREILKASGVRLPSITKQASRQASGKSLELQYFRMLKRLLNPYFQDIEERLIPALSEIVEGFNRSTKVDDERLDQTYGEVITRRIRDIRLGIALQIPESQLRLRSEDQANNISRFGRNQFDKQVRTVLGVNPIMNEPYLEPQVRSFVERNAALIKDIPEQSLSRLETKLRTRIEAGDSLAKVTATVQSELKVAKNRAKLIARDQTNKFMGKLTELRQTALGVEEYIWSTSRDERVRPTHRANQGKKIKWSDPPSATGHPGHDINCRCVAIPVLEDFKPGRNIKTVSNLGTALVGAAIAEAAIKKTLEKVEI